MSIYSSLIKTNSKQQKLVMKDVSPRVASFKEKVGTVLKETVGL